MKYKKKELLKMLDTLVQANQAVGKADIRALAKAGETFEQCQIAAIEIGTYLERYGDATAEIVTLLEDYCENIYQQSIQTDAPDICRKISKRIQKQLFQIINAVRQCLPEDIKEVIFLPYMASMWDCMESVWMAARDDENCDAYVIPIPYYERNADGSLGEMHYEGNAYPDDVPITDWQKYNIEERRPDVVYIQNPYDNCNLVTCVHPQFFSSELKKHTDMLVYLPYFVGINNRVGEHFCTTPGVMHADRVIVQSKEVKQIYIDAIRKFERENNCKGAFGNLDQKILPLGSPKLDRVKRVMDSGTIQIPEEWKSKVYKTNGEKKKVIFYNTTIDALLKRSGTYMRKLENVLALFRQEKEFALLWRPHPLLAATIKSMRPDLYQEYMKIVEAYQNEGWGIYDESADIDRAIVLSDAYYGDMSSVVEMYKVTGKPILIQNCEIRAEA